MHKIWNEKRTGDAAATRLIFRIRNSDGCHKQKKRVSVICIKDGNGSRNGVGNKPKIYKRFHKEDTEKIGPIVVKY